MAGKEKLGKIYSKKLFLQIVLAFIDVVIDIITSATSFTQITCDVMCVQYVTQ